MKIVKISRMMSVCERHIMKICNSIKELSTLGLYNFSSHVL